MPIKTQTYSFLADKASKRLIHSVNEWCMGKYSQNYVCEEKRRSHYFSISRSSLNNSGMSFFLVL